ncbi:MAG: hypothetical protein IJ693_12110 [Bacteroidaceae bacterium]|nr:hypothetical protein [Bacteroidaceae bacterium]
MKKILAMAMLMLAMLPAQAQVEEIGGFDFTKKKAEQEAEAKRAQEAAKEAAEKAAEARRAAAEAERLRLKTEEDQRLAQEQSGKKKGKEKPEETKRKKYETRVKTEAQLMADSLKLVRNHYRLQTWKRRWFFGGEIGPNLSVADNITDHPPFRYSEAIGLTLGGYAGRFFSKNFGVRVGLEYSHVKNRMDNEWVSAWQFKQIYKGNGFFHFDAMEVYGDALFDISGVSRSSKFYPLHVMWVIGVGMIATSEKKMDMKTKDETDLSERGSVAAWNMLRDYQLDEEGNVMLDKDGNPVMRGEYSRFEHLTKTKSGAYLEARFGFLFDYRVMRNLSLNFDLIVTITDDKFEGIKYAEPFDFLVKPTLGLTFHF